MDTVKVTKLNDLNTLVIRKEGGRFFISTDNSIIISITNLSYLLKFLVFSGMISPKVLEGVLSEYYDS